MGMANLRLTVVRSEGGNTKRSKSQNLTLSGKLLENLVSTLKVMIHHANARKSLRIAPSAQEA